VSLVLSLFPGIGLLDRAFEDEGFTVVRGPDVLWGGDVRRFRPPSGVFDGVIGGPPCQMFSRLASMVRHNGYEPRFGNLIPEFERCVAQARPRWWLMENVATAPTPCVDGYAVRHQVVNNRWFVDDGGFGAEQHRQRRVSFGTAEGRGLAWDVALFEHSTIATGVTSSDGGGVMRGNGKLKATAVVSGHGGGGRIDKSYIYSLEDACELQGLPRDFTEHMPFRKDAKLKAVANGVPLPMGRAIARAVKRAIA